VAACRWCPLRYRCYRRAALAAHAHTHHCARATARLIDTRSVAGGGRRVVAIGCGLIRPLWRRVASGGIGPVSAVHREAVTVVVMVILVRPVGIVGLVGVGVTASCWAIRLLLLLPTLQQGNQSSEYLATLRKNCCGKRNL